MHVFNKLTNDLEMKERQMLGGMKLYFRHMRLSEMHVIIFFMPGLIGSLHSPFL